MILPALALANEVGQAVAEADRHDRVPHTEAAAREYGSERERHPRHERNPEVPPVERPVIGPAQARVERHEIPRDDVVPRRERADPSEPGDDREAWDHDRRREDREARPGVASASA